MHSQDDQSASKMLKKHHAQEQSIDDFASILQTLSKFSSDLAEEKHPET